MKRQTLLLATSLLALTAANARAELRNEPAEFRGIGWGAPIENVQDQLAFVRQDGDIAIYRRPSDTLMLGQAQLVKVAYRFYKGRFSAGMIQSYGKGNAQALQATMLSQHGEPVRPYKHVKLMLWEGAAAYVTLTCEITTYCAAEFVSREIADLERTETGSVSIQPRRDDD